MRRFRLAALFALTIAALPASGIGYLRFDGITGDSTAPGFVGWSRFDAVQVDLHIDPTSLGGGSAPRPTLGFSFSMPADSSYPDLANELLRGRSISRLDVSQLDSFGNTVFEHDLIDLFLSDLRLTQGPDGARLVGQVGSVDRYQATTRAYSADGTTLLRQRTVVYDFNGGAAANGTAPLGGDYNGDGLVNLADRDDWASLYGADSVPLGGTADGNADGRIDAADYAVWRDNYPGFGIGAAAVPEPPATLSTVAAVALARRRRGLLL